MNSKQIGNSYEREVAKILSEWFTGSKEELVVWRTAGSGNVETLRKKSNKKTKGMSGDFQALDLKYAEFFENFYIDSKSLTKVNLYLLDQKNQTSNILLNEWKKVKQDTGDKIPLMIVKIRDNRKISDFVVLPYNFLVEFNNIAIYHLEAINIDIRIINLKEFLELNKWQDLIKLAEQIRL